MELDGIEDYRVREEVKGKLYNRKKLGQRKGLREHEYRGYDLVPLEYLRGLREYREEYLREHEHERELHEQLEELLELLEPREEHERRRLQFFQLETHMRRTFSSLSSGLDPATGITPSVRTAPRFSIPNNVASYAEFSALVRGHPELAGSRLGWVQTARIPSKSPAALGAYLFLPQRPAPYIIQFLPPVSNSVHPDQGDLCRNLTDLRECMMSFEAQTGSPRLGHTLVHRVKFRLQPSLLLLDRIIELAFQETSSNAHSHWDTLCIVAIGVLAEVTDSSVEGEGFVKPSEICTRVIAQLCNFEAEE